MAAPRKTSPRSRQTPETPAVPSTMMSPEPGSPDQTESPNGAMNGSETIDPTEVAAEAYSLYLERGGQDGDDLGDWYAAEEIGRQRHAARHDRGHDE